MIVGLFQNIFLNSESRISQSFTSAKLHARCEKFTHAFVKDAELQPAEYPVLWDEQREKRGRRREKRRWVDILFGVVEGLMRIFCFAARMMRRSVEHTSLQKKCKPASTVDNKTKQPKDSPNLERFPLRNETLNRFDLFK
jgi:hypothetical protein